MAEPRQRAGSEEVPDQFGYEDAWLHALPGGGRAYIDRPLPFLVLGRFEKGDTLGLARRVATISPSNLVWPDTEAAGRAALDTLRTVLDRQREKGDQFLVVTLYDLPFDPSLDEESSRLEPFRFVLSASADEPAQKAAGCLTDALEQVRIDLRRPKIESVDHGFEDDRLDAMLDRIPNLSYLSLGLPQIHRVRGEQDRVYPQIRNDVETAIFDVLLQACATFVRVTEGGPKVHYRAFGRSRLVDAALKVDRELDRISRSFDFLLSVSPINTTDAYEQFQACKCKKVPRFRYRPLTVSPEQTKRALYAIDVHAAEDPVLETLFREKQRELDLQLLMLQTRNTSDFRYTSLLQYGPVEKKLLEQAHAILEHVEPGSRPASDTTPVDCHAVETAAKSTISGYRKQSKHFEGEVCLREDIGMGLMVTGQQLLVSTATRMPRGRLDPLLQHEIGVHMLTAVNGNHQPLGIFGSGLANYEGVQEGLGVFAEFLVDGLTDARLRLLAARVLVVEAMLSGAGFIDCYHLLAEDHAFRPRAAFNIVARIFRSGGLTKDAIYLRGLQQVFDFVARGDDLAPFWFGKIAEHHVTVVDELLERGLLREPLATPEFLSRPIAQRQMERIREGASFIELVSAS